MGTAGLSMLQSGVAGSLLAACKEEEKSSELARFAQPLPIPRVMAPTSTDATTDYFTINQRAGSQAIVAGKAASPIEGYEGTWPGPILQVRKGRPAVVTMVNQLPHPTVTHNHGQSTTPDSDGHPFDYVQPGATKIYRYPNDQSAGTYWYHDHTMDLTAQHVWNGLAGMYIIRDDTWEALGIPGGEFEVPLIIQDRELDADGKLLPIPNSIPPGFATKPCVNGAFAPFLQVANRKYLFRVLNASNERPMDLVLDPGNGAPPLTMVVVGTDGSLLPAPAPLTDLLLGPAERYDIVVDFSAVPVGSTVTMKNVLQLPGEPFDDIMRFDVTRSAPNSGPIAPALVPFQRFDIGTVQPRRLEMDLRNNVNYLNGLRFDPSRIDFELKLDQLEVWDIVERSGIPHTFHLHLVPFQIVNYNGYPPGGQYGGWKDTVLIPANGTVRIAFKPAKFTGTYVFHCHMLLHEDNRMMGQMRVSPAAVVPNP